MSSNSNSTVGMKSEPEYSPEITLETLAAEQAGAFDGGAHASLPAAPGEPQIRQGDMADLFALSLIALGDIPGPTGKELQVAFEDVVGHPLASGTVYPTLHEFDDENLLVMAEFDTGKRYQIGDATAVDDRLAEYEKRLRWWLRLCLTARQALDDD